MPEDTVDSLVIAARFDETGLDASVRAQLGALRTFVSGIGTLANQIPPLDLEVGPLAQSIKQAGGDVAAFFAGLKEGIQEGVTDAAALTSAIRQIPPAPAVGGPAVTATGNVASQLAAQQVQALRLADALGRAEGATAALAQATQPPITLNTAPATTAGRTLIDTLGLATTTTRATRQALAQPITLTVQTSGNLLQFDAEGQARAVQAQLSQIQRFADALTTASSQATGEAKQIFAQFVAEANDLVAFPDMSSADAQREVDELITAFTGVNRVIGTLDTTGVLTAIARQARQAAESVRESVAVLRQAAGAGVSGVVPVVVPPIPPTVIASLEAARSKALDLTAALANTGVATRNLAAATQQPVTLNTVAATNAAQTLIDKLGLATRTGQSVRLELARPITLTVVSRGNLDVLASGLIGLQEKTALAQARLDGLRGTMLQQGQAARRAAGDNAAAAAALGTYNAQQEKIVANSQAATRGLNLMRGAAVGVATQALGTTGAVGSLAAGLLFLAEVPSVAIIGISALVIAMQALEAPTKKAREETDKLITSLKDAARARLPQFTQMTDQINEVKAASDAAIQRIADLQEKSRAQGAGGGIIFGGEIKAEVARVKELQAALQALIPLQRAPESDAAANAARQAGADVLAAEQQAIRAQEQLVQAAFAQELITREQFYAERRALAQQAAGADIAALARQKAEILAAPAAADDRAGQIAQRVEISSLEAQIKLRQAILVMQTAEIANEKALADAMLFRQAGFGDAGGVSDLQPGETDFDVTLRPRFDLTQVTADVEALINTSAQIKLDDNFQAELERAEGAARFLDEALGDIGLSLEDIGNANITGNNWDKAADDIAAVGNALGQVGDQLGFIDEQGQQAIRAMVDLGRAIASGDILGVVTGLASLGSAVFGKDATEREHDRILQQNTDAVKQLTQAQLAPISREDFTQAGAGLSQAVDAGNISKFSELLDVEHLADLGTAQIEAELNRFGVSLVELDRIARANGIQLFDDSGRLIKGSVEELNAAIESGAINLAMFGRSLAEETNRVTLRSRLTGAEQDPAQAFENQLQGLRGVGAGAIADLFGNPANEAAVRQAALNLLSQFEAGTIDLAALGITEEELIAFLGSTADYLDSFGESVNDATNRLNDFNLPSGFKAAALAALAATPGGPTLPAAPPLRVTPFTPRLPNAAVGSTTVNTSVGEVTITVNAAAGQSAEQVAQTVLAKFREIAMAQSGDTLQIGLN